MENGFQIKRLQGFTATFLMGVIVLLGVVSAQSAYENCEIYGTCKPLTAGSSVNNNTIGNVNSSTYWGSHPYTDYDKLVPYTNPSQSINISNQYLNIGNGSLTGALGADARLFSNGSGTFLQIESPSTFPFTTEQNPAIQFSTYQFSAISQVPVLKMNAFSSTSKGIGIIDKTLYVLDTTGATDANIYLTNKNYPTTNRYARLSYISGTTDSVIFSSSANTNILLTAGTGQGMIFKTGGDAFATYYNETGEWFMANNVTATNFIGSGKYLTDIDGLNSTFNQSLTDLLYARNATTYNKVQVDNNISGLDNRSIVRQDSRANLSYLNVSNDLRIYGNTSAGTKIAGARVSVQGKGSEGYSYGLYGGSWADKSSITVNYGALFQSLILNTAANTSQTYGGWFYTQLYNHDRISGTVSATGGRFGAGDSIYARPFKTVGAGKYSMSGGYFQVDNAAGDWTTNNPAIDLYGIYLQGKPTGYGSNANYWALYSPSGDMDIRAGNYLSDQNVSIGDSYLGKNLNISGKATIGGNVVIGGNFSAKRPYFNGYDNSTQTCDGTNAFVVNITNNNDYDSYGIHVVNNQNLTFDMTGDYLITFMPEFYEPAGQSGIITFWIQQNGTDIKWSNSRYTLASNTYNAPSISYQVDIHNPQESIRFMWYSDNANTILYSSGPLSSPTRPSIPAVLINVQKVSELT